MAGRTNCLALMAVCATATLALVEARPVAAEPRCSLVSPDSQFGRIEMCASSVLSPQGRNSYAPGNAADGEMSTAWVEGVPGHGSGQWIEYVFDSKMRVQTLAVVNGYAKSAKAFRDNARIRRFQISFDDRVIYEGQLADTPKRQTIRLARPMEARWMRLIVVDSYPGARWDDLAVSEFWVDLEEQNYN